MIKIPPETEYVIDTINKNGYEAYIVGGCVRDMLMGKIPHDYDVTTSALPGVIEELFDKTVPTGIKHGTVTVIIEKSPIEVTTYRTESGYNDSRHPDKVSFVSSLKEDLARRDFTVNAIAFNNESGIVDYFGGTDDLKNTLLRAVGDPKKRFCEDALRILRLFRFASVLDFKCEQNTLNAAVECSGELSKISGERIFSELYKAAGGKNFKVIKQLILCGGLEFLKLSKIPDFEAVAKAGSSDLAFFMFLLFSSLDTPETLRLLKVSNRLKNYCLSLAELAKEELPHTKPELKNLLCSYSPDILRDFLELKNICELCDISDTENLLDEIINNSEPYKISDLKINGEDLKALGLSGDSIGKTLKRLQKAVINDPQKNSKEKLIKEILP